LLADCRGGLLRDLRISVTDRCHFRCLYCLSETEAAEQSYQGRWADSTASIPITRDPDFVPPERAGKVHELHRRLTESSCSFRFGA
jgi:uncharacterized radical SAM superfamily Fe-S cluster-containing enzyme